jgi:signal transduction histidine kinase
LQAALIVLPVTILSFAALFSLRGDRAAVLQEARDNSAPFIHDLTARLGTRLSWLIASEPIVKGVIANGRIESPSDRGALITPPEWLADLTPADSALWRQAQVATYQHPDAATVGQALTALRLSTTSPDARANADLLLLDLDHASDAERYVDLARRNPGVLTDSGAPLCAVALTHALRAAPNGPLPAGFLPELTRQVQSSPSFLTGNLLDWADRVPNLGRPGELQRLHELWNAWQETVAVLQAILQANPTPGSAFTKWAPGHKSVGFAEPTDHGWNVRVLSRDTLSRLFQRALADLHMPLPISSAALWIYIGNVRILPDEVAHEQAKTLIGAAEGSTSYPNPSSFSLMMVAGEDALFARQRTRTYQIAGLTFCAAAAALIGLAALWRSHQRQARLNELKSNFVSSVSHELRAPLGAVRLMAENLEREKIPEPDQQKEYFRLIGQECRRLTTLVENVLDFSRMEAGRKQYTFEPLDLVPLLQHTVAVMQPFAAERGVDLLFTPPPDPPQPSWDAAAIVQSLVNLIDNAIKHSPSGATVTLEIESLPDTLRLWVRDTGPGIPTDEQERIFDLFYRRGSELRRETTGAGIGLSIVKHVAEAHRGRVIVVSEVGKGSAFALELPCRSVYA